MSMENRTQPAGPPPKRHKILAVLYTAGELSKTPGFLGCLENGLGLQKELEKAGHEFIVTDSKEGPDSELERLLPTITILITTPFHPAYMTPERMDKAKKLELILTAGIGSDHIHLESAAKKGLTVAEATGSNVISVAEDEVMRILLLVRNFVPAHEQMTSGVWNVAEVASKAHDLQGKVVGTVGAGRIGQEVMKRLKPFDCSELLYYARHDLPKEVGHAIGCRREGDFEAFLRRCDVVTVNVPLTDHTRNMFNKETIGKMKRGALLVNNARGAIVERGAVVEACESGQLGGYSGDVWDEQPPSSDHPWRRMKNGAMTAHVSGTTLEAQERYASATKDMLFAFFEGRPFPEDNYIVREGKLAHQYS